MQQKRWIFAVSCTYVNPRKTAVKFQRDSQEQNLIYSFFFCSCLHLSLSRLLFSMLQTQFYLLEHLEAFRKCWLSSSFRPAFANRVAFNTRRLEWFALFALDLKDDGYLLDKMCMCLLKPTPGMILFFCHAGWSLATMFLETSNDDSLHTSLLPVPALKYLYSKRVFLVFKHPFV